MRRSLLRGNSPSFRLDGKIAVVTGGASGIGRAVVQTFASCGAQVRVLDIDEDAANKLACEAISSGGDPKAFRPAVPEQERAQPAFNQAFPQRRLPIPTNN